MTASVLERVDDAIAQLDAMIAETSDRVDEVINPLPKQQEFFDAIFKRKRRYVLYGGAAGPGKSYSLRWAMVKLHLWWAQQGITDVRTGLFCEDYPTLRDRQIVRMKREFPRWLGEVRETRDEGLGFFLSPAYGGGYVALRNLDDPSKYASSEFAAIGVDELTKNDKQTFDDLRFRLRWPGVSYTPFLGGSNPGSIGHGWVKKLWIDGDFSGEDENLKAEWFEFIRALPRDNPYLDESYWEQLHSLPKAMRRAMEEGDWDVFAGQVFSEWRQNLHVVEPFTIPPEWTRWTATDYGFVDPFCTLWFARSPDKKELYVYREAYQTGQRAQIQARIVKRWSEGERIDMHAADPSMWAKREGLAGDTLADEYLRAGVKLEKANNDRLTGWNAVHEALSWKELPGEQAAGRIIKAPRLRVFSTCKNLIRTLPALPYDSIRVEDVDTDAEDHAADALRYGVMVERQRDTRMKPPEVRYIGRGKDYKPMVQVPG